MPKSRKLRIGLVFDDSLDSNDGVAQYVKTLGAWLTAQGHQVKYLVGETKLESWQGAGVYSLAKNVSVIFNGNRMSIPLPASRRKIRRILKNENFDILHVMMPYSPFLAQPIINNAPRTTAIIGTFHIFPSGPISKIGAHQLKLMYGRSLRRFCTVISVSTAAADFARQVFKIDSKVIPNPIDLSKYQFVKLAKNNNLQVVFLGRLVKRKGCRELIVAFSDLIKDLPKSHLIIAGDGPLRQKLEKLSQKLGLNSHVKFLGFISEEDKSQLLASADVACFPSLYGESFGIVLLEAMAAGAQVVLGGDNPGYRSVLADQPGLLINPADTKSFAERLKTLLTDEGRRQKIHKWQQAFIKQYDVKIIGDKVLTEYYLAIARLDKKSDNKHYE